MNRFTRDLFNIPNSISLLRLAATPLLAVFWLGLDMRLAGLIMGIVVGITDLLDGILARKLNQTTELGALIDQLGDLVFESTALIIAVVLNEIWVGWLLIYLFREFTVTVLRTFVYSKGGTLPSSWIGKAKSACIQWAFFLVFLGIIVGEPGVMPPEWTIAGVTPADLMIYAGLLSIVVGIITGLLSAWLYLKAFGQFYTSRMEHAESAPKS